MKNPVILFLGAAICVAGCQSAPAPADLSKMPPNPGESFVQQMSSKYQGDASKLTPEEKAQMDKITHGNTAMAMSAGKKHE